MKVLFFVFITYCLLVPVPAQTSNLSKSHNVSPYPPLIVLDGLEITREEIEEWGIEKKVIKRIKHDSESECSGRYYRIIRLYTKM